MQIVVRLELFFPRQPRSENETMRLNWEDNLSFENINSREGVKFYSCYNKL